MKRILSVTFGFHRLGDSGYSGAHIAVMDIADRGHIDLDQNR